MMTGIGPVPVKVPRVRDRKPGEERISFTPSILPRYLRRAKSVEELLPWLYLSRAGKRISPMTKITFAALLDYAWQDGFCFPAQDRLARDIGADEKSIRKYLAELQ